MATQLIARHEVAVTSPTFGPNGELYTVAATGEIFKYTGNIVDGAEISVESWGSSSGQPLGVALDSQGAAFLCDAAHQALFRLTRSEDGRQSIEPYVKEYEGCPLLGPNSVALAKSTGTVYFTDSGPLGETTLANAAGSVYAVSPATQMLVPLLHKALAHPSGLALAPDDSVLYVSETSANRILRFAQHPAGVYHCSVFHQLSGRLGPMGIATSPQGELFVAHFDFRDNQDTGRIVVIDPDGEVTAIKHVPGAEVTGVAVSPCGRVLLVTEASTRSLYRVPLAK